MNEQRNNGKGIFYGVIGVATLVVAIIGATFAYFTASASVNNVITGNMASVSLSLSVTPIETANSGMIPMSNSMVQAAATNDTVCVDDNGNEVCQIYKITIDNQSSAGQFVDGYVSLRYGSGEPTDYVDESGETKYTTNALFKNSEKAPSADGVGTTMRWAQVFTENEESYSTAGTQTLGAEDETIDLEAIGVGDTGVEEGGYNKAALLDSYEAVVETDGVNIAGTDYDAIGTNFIRVSNHDWTKKDANNDQTYDREEDITSALVYNHSIAAGGTADYYIIVWLAETGTNQTAGADTTTGTTAADVLNYFDGNVTFISAQGSEVTATFNGYTKVGRTD